MPPSYAPTSAPTGRALLGAAVCGAVLRKRLKRDIGHGSGYVSLYFTGYARMFPTAIGVFTRYVQADLTYCVLRHGGGCAMTMGIPPKSPGRFKSAEVMLKVSSDQVFAQLPPYLVRGISAHFVCLVGGMQLHGQGLSSSLSKSFAGEIHERVVASTHGLCQHWTSPACMGRRNSPVVAGNVSGEHEASFRRNRQGDF